MDIAGVSAEEHLRPSSVVAGIGARVPAISANPPFTMAKLGVRRSFLNGMRVRRASGRACSGSSRVSRSKTPGDLSTGAHTGPHPIRRRDEVVESRGIEPQGLHRKNLL